MGEIEVRSTGDGTTTLYSSGYGQTFHSHHGALSESRHVFLEGSGAGEALRRGEPLDLLEVGFGTGLNFLVTAELALDRAAPLRYTAIERELLPADLLEVLGLERIAPRAAPAYLAFRRQLPDVPWGRHTLELGPVELELALEDASAVDWPPPESFDVIYHDAFSPDENPVPWQSEFLARIATWLRPGGCLVTFTVKGDVRRALAEAGLRVRKLPGPSGGKREMLRADKPTGS